MIITVFAICAVLASGGYDCDEKWAIYVYDDMDVWKYCYPGVRSFHLSIAGCGTFDNMRGHSIILGNSGYGTSHTGHSVLYHEILHLQCLCNFHGSPPDPPKR